jgi:hypothetical protein
MHNVYVVAFVFWPCVVLLCAGINMLVSWTFSWSELVFDYLAGVLAGYLLFAGASPDAGAAATFFFVFSHGLFAWIWAASEGFRHALGDPATFFWTLAGIRLGATLWAAALDYGSVALGARLAPGPFFYSFLVAPAKLPFALVTSAVGLAIWVAGLFWAIFGSGKSGFAGGVFFTEFSPGGGGHYATTLGCTVNTWYGDTPFKHELYHTRQYIYLCDWLIPFWCLGILWGFASAAISTKHEVSTQLAFGADKKDEVGNPLEVAAFRLA